MPPFPVAAPRTGPAPQSYSREGASIDETQIIGVELAVSPGQLHGGEVELDMFACRHTIPLDQFYGDTAVRITLHTSRGDRTIRGFVRW